MFSNVLRRAVLLLALAACNKPGSTTATSSSCTLTDDGGALDVSNRLDGLYGLIDDRVSATPLARFEHIARTGSGVAPEGKKWVGLHFEGEEAQSIQDFTASPRGRGVVGVVSGAVIFRHKIRVPITSADVQVSCCNPAYCDRWDALLMPERDR